MEQVYASFTPEQRLPVDERVEVFWRGPEHDRAAALHGRQLRRPGRRGRVGLDLGQRARRSLRLGRDSRPSRSTQTCAPSLNVSPRPTKPPHRSGREFAKRNLDRGPYFWLSWNSKEGALIQPHVTAPAVHQLLDSVEADVLSKDASLSAYVLPRPPSPWINEKGEWWPRPDVG
jgi:hypothetical protein